MNTHQLPLYLFALCLLAVSLGCDPPEDPQPADCEYDIPQLAYSDAQDCEPELVTLTGLDAAQEGSLPDLPEGCFPGNPFTRVVELSGAPASGRIVLQVYNGSAGTASVQVFGATDCTSTPVALTDCVIDDAVGFKLPVAAGGTYERFYVRVDLFDAQTEAPYAAQPSNFVALAAYDGKEPSFTTRMSYNKEENKQPGQSVVPPPQLPVSCDGLTFHRLIFTACSSEQDLKAWADEMGLPVSESYKGDGGAVLAADAPEGMNLQTIGGAAKEQRPKQDTTGTTVEPDYIISLFNPDDPTDYFSGGLEPTSVKDENIQNCVAFAPRGESTDAAEQVLVTIIDSGVDVSEANADLWKRTIYRQSLSTNFITNDQLGYDFIQNDVEPDDQVPHGTFVAGAVVGGYRGEQPLTTVHFKIFGAEKAASYYGALVAIREALTIESDVINMSWGFYNQEPPLALQCLVEEAQAREVVLVTSAGNETAWINSNFQWPASFAAAYPETVVSVASYQYPNDYIDPADLELTSFSNRGAPDAAVAAFMTTETPRYGSRGTAYYLGTSISAPIVTRTVANLEANGSGDVPTLQSLYDSAPQLRGQIHKESYLPVCLKFNAP